MSSHNRIAALAEEVGSWRRDFHQHPELGFEEVRTARLVAGRLRAFGLEVHEGIARTGVVGVLHGAGGSGGPAVGLRADMDALPMPDAKAVLHRSTVPGKMHGCGHDGHTAMLLGAAQVLSETRNFEGTVYVIFQPAEEGLGGGRAMVEEGLFRRFPMRSVWGLHNWPGLPLGSFAVHAGPVMAGVDYFDITVRGRGCHAGMPHEGVDTVLAASHLVTALQSVASRNVPPSEAVAVGIPYFHAGEFYHVMPEEVRLKGSARTFDAAVRDLVEARIRKLVASTVEAFGAEAAIDYRRNYPPTLNDAASAETAAAVAAGLVGAGRVRRDLVPSMAAEDFAFMLGERPGCYVWMGQDDAAHEARLHHPAYDFNDAAIPTGMGYWVTLVERLLPRS